jgi:hypothetical protein
MLAAFAGIGLLLATGKRKPGCVREAARELAQMSAQRAVPEQLEFANRLDELGYPAAAACLRAQGQGDCRPLMTMALEKELPRSTPATLQGFALLLDAIGEAKSAQCLRALADTAGRA